jgi:hypothetical protein
MKTSMRGSHNTLSCSLSCFVWQAHRLFGWRKRLFSSLPSTHRVIASKSSEFGSINVGVNQLVGLSIVVYCLLLLKLVKEQEKVVEYISWIFAEISK